MDYADFTHKTEELMNFRQKFGVCLLLCTTMCGAAHAQIVAVPESNLARAVRTALRLPPNVQLTNNL